MPRGLSASPRRVWSSGARPAGAPGTSPAGRNAMPATSTAATSGRRPWSTAKVACLLAAVLAGSPGLATAAAEITRRSPDDVAGRDLAAGAEFAAHAQGDIVTVELDLRGGKRITARI